ncbi:type I restriction endonuclease subunit R [Campylobacter jejuni]|uniref:type I restriction endonuclease subunit R n=1 Tax=Campylobacter jejuni TaxID=197 RepID=UPI00126AA9FF|nr:type I restriction endonuclease subunit R [Campylobacter jejuni]EAH8031387.1 HsdR family type I site-specific deoxyribonuclease [Campylobacter jejuni]ECK7846406.1 HsdR family type I site-specific deoxyribonuclease [Campylobacter jejuni]ECO7136135.1 HsdR family type I site-specific deoxyribonuclease [Campylobacter jejuni]ECP8814450.1 HsdR family type I site-specific deoxyribonuclease [Campylobacter jejuni]EDO8323630.1 HsdR family type I site-specific deoxyribonuclease [Campylobacter jejuni]
MSKAKTSEFDLEQFVISSLLEHGWCYEKPVRATDEVLLETSLVNALCRLNPQLDLSKANEIYKELKSPSDENATINSAYNQINTYKQTIPSIFTYNAFCVISDGYFARAGSISADFSRFMAWKSSDGINYAPNKSLEIKTLIDGMLNPKTLLDIICNFIVFEKEQIRDLNGILSIKTTKKIACYHQYYAVNKAISRTITASSKDGDKKGGVVWHTQGSGKSLSMVFYSAKAIKALNNPTILLITDRNDLDDQLFGTFASCANLLRQEPKQANDKEHLKELLRVASGGVVFTTIQKFSPENDNVFECLSLRDNIIVIADEAHRTQYGFDAKVVEEKSKSGDVLVQKIVYGFAKYLRDALPNATYIGFTGTPIESHDINTPAVFGNYIDIYDISRAVEDGATVSIYYESRLAKIELSEEGKRLVNELDEKLENQDSQKAKATKLEALVGSTSRLKQIAKDIVKHFETRSSKLGGKGMIVSISRSVAIKLYDEIIKIRPSWHSDELSSGAIKVVMTSSSSDGVEFSKHHTSKIQKQFLANRMRNIDDELKLVIVVDMWLTGFDVPSLHTLYIDKPMKGHNLMQAIARVNRVYKDKPSGLVVDYLGIASDLKKALSFYSESGGKGDIITTQEDAVKVMIEKLEIVEQMLPNDYEKYFELDTGAKLEYILDVEEHILSNEDGKNRFIKEFAALDKAYTIAMPHEKALSIKNKIAFMYAIKARFLKFAKENENENLLNQALIKQVVDKAIVSSKVVDIFDASGIKKPDISILSDEFLLEVKNMKRKNLAFEMLKKILNDEIKAREKLSLTKAKKLAQMLSDAIKKYNNKLISSSEALDELINMSKSIVSMEDEAKKLGLKDYEYAFYSALACNDEYEKILGNEKLLALVSEILQIIKNNVSIDWMIKENVRARLRVAVKRVLNKYGYPPDMQQLAIDGVLAQAEILAKELANE